MCSIFTADPGQYSVINVCARKRKKNSERINWPGVRDLGGPRTLKTDENNVAQAHTRGLHPPRDVTGGISDLVKVPRAQHRKADSNVRTGRQTELTDRCEVCFHGRCAKYQDQCRQQAPIHVCVKEDTTR